VAVNKELSNVLRELVLS